MFIYPIAILLIEDDGDRAFMEGLYRDMYKLMFHKAYSIVRSKQDAEDVVNDACVSLICKISILRDMERSTLRSYIVSTIRNTAFNCLSRASRRKNVTLDDQAWDVMVSPERQPDEAFFLKNQMDCLRLCIDRLPERDQAILRMKYYLGFTDTEIAKQLGLAASTIRAYQARLRGRLFSMLKEAHGNE